MSEEKTTTMRLIAATILLMVAYLVERLWVSDYVFLACIYAVPYLIAGYEVLEGGLKSLTRGHGLDEDFLISIATLGAFAMAFIPNGELMFHEAVAVMLLFEVGELFEDVASGRTRREITKLVAIRPEMATRVVGTTTEVVAPAELQLGDICVVAPGEKIPCDGVVVEGSSSLDTVALTGESMPRDISIDDQVFSGCVNLSGVITIKITKTFDESSATKILELVEHASQRKSSSEKFISKFARIYTPIVVAMAVLLAFVPPLISGNFSEHFATWLVRGLMFLVVSCPCALVISVPLTFFGGIGAASTHGILIKGSNYIDALAHVKRAVFDKTGTLTQGIFSVVAVHPDAYDERELLHLAAHVEAHSTHPIARALRKAFPETDDTCIVNNIQELAGMGIIAEVNGRSIAVGNTKLMEHVGAHAHACHTPGTTIHLAEGVTYLGHIVIADELKASTQEGLNQLKGQGIALAMISGDTQAIADEFASKLGIDTVFADCMPQDKVDHLEELIEKTHASAQKEGMSTLAYVGDGINDAPVLARADVGIAMGGLGSDAAIEAADVVLMDDKVTSIAQAIDIARKTRRIAYQNIVFAIGVKVAILILAALGLAPMWLAVFGDVGVMVIAVANATRSFGNVFAVVKQFFVEDTPEDRALMEHAPHADCGCGCGCGCDDDDNDDCCNCHEHEDEHEACSCGCH